MNKKKIVAGAGMLLLLLTALPQGTRCALSCDVWVDGGCGSTHQIGQQMNIYFSVSEAAYIKLWLTYPDGNTVLKAEGEVCARTYYQTGTVGEPAGKRTLLLEAWSGNEYDSDTCIYYGGKPPGSIRVESTPSGANCYLDGTYKGSTPLTIAEISPGSYTITLRKDGYYDWEDSVYVQAGETSHVYATLKVKVGSLDVNANVSGASVYVDGDYKGATPLRIDNVPAGNHTIRISAEKYYDYVETVTVEANRVTTVEAALEKKPGSIYVESTPSGASVYLDESYKGKTPLTIPDVPEGTHRLTLTYPGYNDWATSVYVYADEVTTERVSMHKVFWRTGYFAAGVILILCILLALIRHKGKKPLPAESPITKAVKGTVEASKRIARAGFFPIEKLLHITVPEKENQCPICNGNLDKGEILKCNNCEGNGFTCKMHKDCWEEHKSQQKENKVLGKIRCHTHPEIYISEKNISPLPQGLVKVDVEKSPPREKDA